MLRTPIISVGNILMSDEDMGIAAARALMDENLTAGVEVVDACCALCDTLTGPEGLDRVIEVDAVRSSGNQGDVCEFESTVLVDGRQAPGSYGSLHKIGLPESTAMSELAGTASPVTTTGQESRNIELGAEFSGIIRSRMASVLSIVRGELSSISEGQS